MKQLYIIDAIGFLFRSFFAIRGMKSPDGTPSNALYGFIRSIEKLFHDFPIDNCVAIFDGPNNKASRTAIYADYKGHRSQMPDELAVQLSLAHEFCDLYGIPQLSIPGVEADDVIGSLTKYAKNHGYHIHLISQDKDLCQLIDAYVDMIAVHKDNLLIDTKGVIDIYGVRPDQIVDYLSIIGDSSDNIPGISGIGPKSAVKLLQEFDTLENMYDNLDKIDSDKKRQQIFEAKEIAFLSQQLAKLDFSVPIPHDFSFYSRKEPYLKELYGFYSKFGFNSLLKDKSIEEKSISIKPKEYSIISSEEALIAYLKMLSSFKQVCVDTETDGLNVMSSSLVGIGLGADRSSLGYIPFNGTIPIDILHTHLHKFFQSEIEFFGHNIKFDLHILKNHDLFPRKICFDTMLASYILNPEKTRHPLDTLALDILNMPMTPIESLIGQGKNQKSMAEVPIEAVASYCIDDVIATIELKLHFEKLIQKEKLEEIYFKVDLPLIPILYEMERHGIYVEKASLSTLSQVLNQKINHLEKEIFKLAGKEFNVKSPKQLGEILFTDLAIATKTKKTQSGFSTSADILESLKDKHPIVPLVLEYRTLEKLRSTYVDALPSQINETTHRIHCTFNQSVTATGRLSCQDPNLQNIPVRSAIGQKIREAFAPQKDDYLFLAADYSQIELRILAHLSDDPTLVNAFKNDLDIHKITASLIFDCTPDLVTDQMRQQAKVVNFGIIYGQQAFGLSKELSISTKEASEFINRYFDRYTNVKKLMEHQINLARSSGYAFSLFGRRRYIEDISSKNPMLRAQAERYSINTPIQSTQSDLIKMAMIKINDELKRLKLKTFLILQIHDELIFEVYKEELDQVKNIVKSIMESIVDWQVPLKVNISVGKNWGEC